MKKAQAEMIVIVGIIVLAAVAILYTFQGSVPGTTAIPTAVAQNQKIVKNSFLSMAEDAAKETVEIMEYHGGYLSADLLKNQDSVTARPSVIYTGQGAPFWQQCGEDVSPTKAQVRAWLEGGLRIHILESIDSLEGSFEKDVQFDTSKLNVNANMLYDRIGFTVNLPTTVQGYAIRQPYTFSVPTNFGRILDFAKDFSKEAADSRFMDYFTITSVHFSSTLPTIGLMISCSETIYLSPEEVKDGMEGAIRYTVGNILLWQEMPFDPKYPKVYAIPDVNGKTYPDLSIRFALPDNFALEGMQPILITNKDKLLLGPFFFQIFHCVGNYNQRYNFAYPAVVSVKDELTGNNFNFASMVHVQPQEGKGSMEAGDCSIINIPEGSCSSEKLACNAKLTVTDGNNPLEGVSAIFGGCYVGKSDSNGVIEGSIQCGEHELNLYHPSQYSTLTKKTTSSEISKTYTLSSIPTLTFYFHSATIEDRGYYACKTSKPETNTNKFTHLTLEGEENYTVSNINPTSLTIPSNPEICKTNPSECLDFTVLEKTTVDYIPTGDYSADGELSNPAASIMIGGFLSPLTVPAKDSDIHVTVPKTSGSLSDALKREATTNLTSFCNLHPISANEVPDYAYTFTSACTCEQLQEIAEELQGVCLSKEEIDNAFASACSTTEVVEMIHSKCDAKIQGVCS